jgi:Galactose oxidase, central domain
MKTITTITYSAFALFALACFGLSPQARAVDPPPDGGYPNQTTVEDEDPLLSRAATPGQWEFTGNLNVARDRHTATLLPNGQVLVAGGSNSSGFLASAERYDPATGTWTVTGSLHTARYGHTATLLPDGRVLVAAGVGTGFIKLASAELYDPATGAWTVTGDLNDAAGRPYGDIAA